MQDRRITELRHEEEVHLNFIFKSLKNPVDMYSTPMLW